MDRFIASIALCCLAVMCLGSGFYILNGKVMAQFDAIPANRVKQLQKDIASGYNTSDLLPTSVEFRTQTNGDGVIYGYLNLDFVSSNSAAATWHNLTNYSFAPGMVGHLTFHMCAIDAANTNGYVACNTTNAFYQVKTFP